MSKKRKPDNGLADNPQLKPLGKTFGKGKGWQKYFQSNAVKASLAGGLVLLLVLIIGWQLLSGGSGTKPIRAMASSDSGRGPTGSLASAVAPGTNRVSTCSARSERNIRRSERPKWTREQAGDISRKPTGSSSAGTAAT